MYKRFAALALALGASSACSDITGQSPVAFQGDLAGTLGGQSISGSVAAASQGRNTTQAGIEAVLPAGLTRVGWQINTGTCASPGALFGGRGAYVDLTPNNSGVARLERTYISASLSENGTYHAVLVDATDRSVVLACGDLERVQFSAAEHRAGNDLGLHG